MAAPLQVIPIPCLRDNYAYLVSSQGARECLVVDPSEVGPVLAALRQHELQLRAIINTHHHWDHVGGNRGLMDELGALPVFGHESERARIPGLDRPLAHRQRFVCVGVEFFVLHVPGHTSGAVALCSADEKVSFTGDTLFCAGCGRLFEGTPEEMYHSLNRVLAELPDETQIFCGHEYTEQNLRFALTIDDAAEVKQRALSVSERRGRGEYCASASLGLERRTNPFLRCHLPAVRKALGGATSDIEAFARLRRKKDAA